MKYFFVEGIDDKYLIDEITKEIEDKRIIEYAKIKKDKTNNYIKACKKMKCEYILLADMDGKNEATRKNELTSLYKDLESEKIFFSVQEIEAWYLAGLSERNQKKYKISDKYLKDTQSVTKEKFQKLFEKTRDTLKEIKFNILSEYDISNAKERNASLNFFLENLNGCFSK